MTHNHGSVKSKIHQKKSLSPTGFELVPVRCVTYNQYSMLKKTKKLSRQTCYIIPHGVTSARADLLDNHKDTVSHTVSLKLYL